MLENANTSQKNSIVQLSFRSIISYKLFKIKIDVRGDVDNLYLCKKVGGVKIIQPNEPLQIRLSGFENANFYK
jgi:hypothetical protein